MGMGSSGCDGARPASVMPYRSARPPDPARPPGLHAQVTFPEAPVAVELLRVAGPDDLAALQDDMAVGQRQQALDVLVDHENGLAGGAQRGQARPDFFA